MDGLCVSLAGIAVRVEPLYAETLTFLYGYETNDAPELVIRMTGGDIERERAAAGNEKFSDPYLETLALYRRFCEAAAERGVLLFHSSSAAVDGRAYLFAAPSGTGKSTHTRLWREVLGERVVMINDDKPLLRFGEDGICVYGTPWNGKHRLSVNCNAPVGAICLLSRAPENSIREVSPDEALPRLFSQTYRPDDAAAMAAVLPLVVRLSREIPVYELSCNMDRSAAELSYAVLSKAAGKGMNR